MTTNAAHRGELEVSRKPIARGKPECLGCTCLIRVRLFYHLHTALRVRQAPGFPCALSSGEGHENRKTRAKTMPRERGPLFFSRD